MAAVVTCITTIPKQDVKSATDIASGNRQNKCQKLPVTVNEFTDKQQSSVSKNLDNNFCFKEAKLVMII